MSLTGGFKQLIKLLHVLCLSFLLFTSETAAQSLRTPALIADAVSYNAQDDILTAEGNVEVFFENRILRAQQIIYHNETGLVEAKGPISLSIEGEATLVADYANLDPDLKSGILQGARLVLAQNFQLAAAEAVQVSGRYQVLNKTVASSCQVCAQNPNPLWLIRANRIVRDTVDKQLHFEGARFEVFGATIAYLPYFRLPDPSVNRATGLLQPEIKSSDTYGTGIRLPYFIIINDSSDVTVTPFFTTSGTNVFDAQYRQRFKTGRFELNGAIGVSDRASVPNVRGYLFAEGDFALANGYGLDFALKRASDKGFLREFGYSESDRLTSNFTVSRQRPSEYISYGTTFYQSLRDGENDANLPYVLPEVSYNRYWDDAVAGGRLTLQGSVTGLTRQLGRDVLKVESNIGWERTFELPFGLRALTFAGTGAQVYKTSDDPNFNSGLASRIIPNAAVELRWPFARSSDQSVQIVEPIAQVVYSDMFGETTNIPNEDSAAFEFDASNLFALNRFPGSDLHETGMRLNLGVNYTRIDRDGWVFGLTLGRVYRKDPVTSYPLSSGLNQRASNFVAAANLDLPPYIKLSNQTLFDDSFSFSRNDIQASIYWNDFTLSSSYVYLLPDQTSGSFSKRQEITLNAAYKLSPNWSVNTAMRRNLVTDNFVSTDFGLEYGNECIRASFSVSRSFTNSNTVPPDTEFGLGISLAGFGGTQESWPSHRCWK